MNVCNIHKVEKSGTIWTSGKVEIGLAFRWVRSSMSYTFNSVLPPPPPHQPSAPSLRPPPSIQFQPWRPPQSVLCPTKLSVAVCQSHINSQPWKGGRAGRKMGNHGYSWMDIWQVLIYINTLEYTVDMTVAVCTVCREVLWFEIKPKWPLLNSS